MNVEVQLFARARDLAKTSHLQLELPAAARVSDLKRLLVERIPGLQPLLPHLIVAIGTEYASDQSEIPAGTAVACFPPVSGG